MNHEQSDEARQARISRRHVRHRRGGLKASKKVRRPLRMGCGGKNRPLVVLQDLEPRPDIGGVILARLRRQVEIGGKKRAAQLGNEFLHRVAFIAPALAPEVTVKP